MMNSIKIKTEAIERELSYICGQLNRTIVAIEETKKNYDNNYISEKECIEAKEVYANGLFEWKGRLNTVITLLETGTEYNVICTYGFKDSIKSINIVKDNEEITITPAICVETDDNGVAYSVVVGLPKERTCNKDTERTR